MARAFTSLERVLKLEAQQGYQNKAVIGGIRQFATFWVGQAREEAVDEVDLALIEQTGELLMDYGQLSGPEARAKAVENLLARLRTRQERVPQPADSPRPPRPKPEKPAPPPPAPKKQSQPAPAPRHQPAAEAPTASVAAGPIGIYEMPSPEPAPTATPVARPTRSAAAPDPMGLRQSVTSLRGVGPKIGEQLERLGATTIGELLYLFPRRYDDFTLMKPINRIKYGEQVTIIGTIWETRMRRVRDQVIVTSIINDGTGSVQATWFNQKWLADKLKAGMQVVLSGKVEQFLGRPTFNNPEWEALEWEPLRTRRIVPVYPLTQGLSSNKMRDLMRTAVEYWAPRVPDPVPFEILERRNLLSLHDAILQSHFPDSQESLHQARQRLVFDELFLMQLGMMGLRQNWRSELGRAVPVDQEGLNRFIESLPFPLTGAQQRVIQEIAADMERDIPMNRLLQGDVGAGKTVVAAAAMVIAVQAGAQAAMMAPTEILAEQHYKGLSAILSQLGIEVRLLTGSTPAAERERIYAELAEGTAHVAVGTHALIQGKVNFKQLAVAVVDEQHRFGVDQRQALRDKGAMSENGQERHHPHMLVMSATPIPRSLALALYGDLDISVLDEMPPGRQTIRTRWLRPRERERAYAFVRGQVEQGRQAFIICPLVEESDKIEAKAAVEEHERLQKEIFPDLRLGLLHGRMKGDEKESVMRAFYQNESNILVSTSVIEVGIDVPNSTVMLIEGANRFGLAQLHQFRGRVGRGEHQSYCILISDTTTADAEERLQALEQTNDGFLLAEKDLELRGPGEFFGRRQSGLPELRLASLMDMPMLQLAREEAQALFAQDPMLEQPKHKLLHDRVAHFWEAAGDVS
jgi:ATP-dependent DNA helicase RecG